MNKDIEQTTVLCGANAYEQKYYFNEMYSGLPESIKEELRIICVLFTQEIGGMFSIVFDKEGNVEIVTDAAEEDILYDEIGSGLLVAEVRRHKQDLFESLRMYYRAVILKEDISALIEEEEN